MRSRTTVLVILFTVAAILILMAQANIHEGIAQPADTREVLMKADADFDTEVAAKGLEAWVATFAEDGMMFRAGEPVKGKAAIREMMAEAFATPGFSLRWKPVAAEIAASGDLGYTYGTYENRTPGPDGKPQLRTGMYVTIWKKDAQGLWKAAVDLGSAAPPPPAEPE
jgi:ketosteroid isomerase-like protein